MGTRILHISDLHFASRNADTADALKAAIQAAKPDFLVASGDFANHPFHLKEPADWLRMLCNDCGVNWSRVIVIPGNHDYRLWGNIGFRPVARRFFERQFPLWGSQRICCFPDSGITFFKFDSNPIAFGFARGRVSQWQLRRMKKEYDAKSADERASIRKSLRIAVVHHHPLPLPHEGGDLFLALSNANGLLQFLAEKQIDIVLHGHKHRAPYSRIRLGTTSGTDRVIDVIAAGSAFADGTDIDSRGNNFNLITIEPTGWRHVEQYFSDPKAATRTFAPLQRGKTVDYFRESCDQRSRAAASYEVRSLDWDILIDEDGGGQNEFIYRGVTPGKGTHLPRVVMPPFRVPVGYVSEPRLDKNRSDPLAEVEWRRINNREIEVEVMFKNELCYPDQADFVILACDFNAYCMDKDELQRRPPHKEDPNVLDKTISEPTGRLTMSVRFPAFMQLEGEPRFEVRELAGDQAHVWLTGALAGCFRFSSLHRIASLQIHNPPVGYRYLIIWQLQQTEKTETLLQAKGEVMDFARWLLEMRQRRWETRPADHAALEWEKEVSRVLVSFYRELMETVAKLEPSKDIDLSLMAADYAGGKHPQTLCMAAGTAMTKPEYRNFSLPTGDGLAGLAYKKGMTRVYSRRKASKDPSAQTYLPLPKFPPHEFLFSIPIRHPAANAHIYAVLNLGTFDEVAAERLETLDREDVHAILLEKAQSYVLPRLLEIQGKMKSGDSYG